MAEQEGTKSPVTADAILGGELYAVLVRAAGQTAPLPSWFVAEKIRAAEDSIEHELQLFFGERRVASNPRARGLDPTTYDVEVAALDYERDFFVEARWGWVYLDYRPIQSIERFFFSYPGTAFAQSYNVPVDWLQADPKFARVQIVPTHGEAIIASFNAWVLSVLAGGRGLPQSIYVDYTAGISR